MVRNNTFVSGSIYTTVTDNVIIDNIMIRINWTWLTLCVDVTVGVFQEHHLQRAISAQQVFREKKENMVIPVPEAETNTTYYDRLYKGEFKVPKQLIHIQSECYSCNWNTPVLHLCPVSWCQPSYVPAALGLDLEQPDYDMDSEDEMLLNRLNRKMELKPLQFETMVDRLEKASTHQVSLEGQGYIVWRLFEVPVAE